MLIEAWCKNVS